MSSLGEVIATARSAQGLTQEQLAAKVGVKQESINRYEKDLRTPDANTVAQLADAFGVTEAFLLRASRPTAAMATEAHMRRRATAKPTVWRRLEARLNMLRMHSEMLREEVSLATIFSVPSLDSFDVDPSEAAKIVRTQWRMPLGPVSSITRWLEAAGCVVLSEDFGSVRVDGLSQWTADHPVVIVNAAASPDRLRWTLAHELGHLVLHSVEMPVSPQDVESEANVFAGEFLMPADLISADLRNLTLGKAFDLKLEWGVSMQAIIERAHRLGMLSKEKRTSLYKQLSARGWRMKEPGSEDIALERPQLMRHIRNVLRDQGWAEAEIAAIAGFKAPAFNELMPREGLRAI